MSNIDNHPLYQKILNSAEPVAISNEEMLDFLTKGAGMTQEQAAEQLRQLKAAENKGEIK